MLTVYSKTVCPYCTQAKNLLKLKNIDFTEVNIEQDTDARNKMVSMVYAQSHKSLKVKNFL
jgi:glutaredoxin 3